MDEYPSLDNQTEVGPTYFLEYSTRGAYGAHIMWGANDPLNATWWHLVTERGSFYFFFQLVFVLRGTAEMERNTSLLQVCAITLPTN